MDREFQMNERINKLAEQAGLNAFPPVMDYDRKETHWTGWDANLEKFAELIVEECAREVEEFARKWWSIHCHSNKHAETTRKAHDDFCSLQRAIRRRGKTE
jgi:hypothetical protein